MLSFSSPPEILSLSMDGTHSLYLYVYIPICLHIYMSIYLYLYLFVYPAIYTYIYQGDFDDELDIVTLKLE